MSGAAVVVERELLRASRRWQTAAWRAGFAAVLLAAVALLWQTEVDRAYQWDSTVLSMAGRRIFALYSGLQFFLLVALTPLLVAQAILEERQARTLQLLTMTRLSARSLLSGKVLSRLLVLEAFVLAGLPVLALALSLGGVEPLELASAFVQANVAIASLAAVSCVAALRARGPVAPALASWTWAFGAWFLAAAPVAAGVDDDLASAVSPVISLFEPEGLVGLLGPALIILPTLLVLFRLAERTFVASAEPEDEELAAGYWSLHGLQRRASATIAGAALLAPFAFIWAAVADDWRWAELVCAAPLWLWTSAVLAAGSVIWLRLVAWGGRRMEARAGRSRLPRTVWRNPVAWRETSTAAYGAWRLWTSRGWALIALVVGFIAVLALADHEYDPLLALSFTLLLLAYAITLLGATSSAVSELRSRSLELLLSTPMSPATIVGGKLAGVATLAAPAVLGAIALLALGLPEFSPALRWEWYDDPADLAGLRRRFAATTLCVLVSVAYLATSTLALTLRARTSARAWTAALGNGTLLALGPPVLAVSSRGRGALGELSELLNPMLSSSFFGREDVPDMAFVSAAFWAVMTGLAFLIACRAVARRVA